MRGGSPQGKPSRRSKTEKQCSGDRGFEQGQPATPSSWFPCHACWNTKWEAGVTELLGDGGIQVVKEGGAQDRGE